MKRSIRAGIGALLTGLCLAFAGCGEDPAAAGTGKRPAAKAKAKKGDAKGVADDGTAAARGPSEPLVLTDDDFAESERNRDPFRSFSSSFKSRPPTEMQRRVVMPNVAVEEMRLIAIVTGTTRPRAMLVDPGGVGHPVERGDYIGRPRVIQATGSVAIMLNWRVDRIRENEVVLTQQDPGDPTRSQLTKVLTLNQEVTASL